MAASCFITAIPSSGFQHPRLLVVPQRASSRIRVHKPVQCLPISKVLENERDDQTLVVKQSRRSGNYTPSIWDDDYLQSLNSVYTGEIYTRQAKCMKEKVRAMIENVSDRTMDQLELIDTLQRLGVSYHFVTEIEKILEKVYINSNDVTWRKENLYAVSLEFRVLRQHGYNVPQEVFNSFIDEKGNFKVCLCDDINTMLSLYEASYYGLEGEIIMEEAWQFTTKHFKSFLADDDIDSNLAMQVRRALELPLHWRTSRVGARWFIDIYERSKDMNNI
ncbi:hypothetical protein Dsin_032626 [Dipteronia sinensis]|uniref:Terpene synthase N-terminal domain-containing protein n=1 Tax=Dipteronia sinensis TaxID=43782 RepID=A0AAD9ZK06_9ROSI|nr:hypothetical protein Dsin_032626 [Dipteronia sinensis]